MGDPENSFCLELSDNKLESCMGCVVVSCVRRIERRLDLGLGPTVPSKSNGTIDALVQVLATRVPPSHSTSIMFLTRSEYGLSISAEPGVSSLDLRIRQRC